MESLPDSTDWLNTPLKDIADLENALHCQICKEFYDTPMITSCSHTFCSKCIRTSLSSDGKCPACRTADQASKLRNNWALQEVVDTFTTARPAAIEVARREQEQAAQAKRPGKRKRAMADSDDVVEHGGRTTRSKSRRIAASQTSQPDAIEIDDSEDDGGAYGPEPPPPDDGLVECPLGCGKRMKIDRVEPHLDRCEDEKRAGSRAKSRTPVNSFNNSARPHSRAGAKPQSRIAELNYSLLKELPMRKKLQEIGIPDWGSKQLMVKRHTEWVNLWNANCDSSHPRTKRELLSDLDTWERTQGGRAPNAQSTLASGVMRKDFDGAGWANKNKDDFSRLIADARRKKNNPSTSSSPPPKDIDPIEDPTKPALNGDEGRSPHFEQSSSRPLPSLLKSESSAPYAEDPGALALVRAKVAAVNAGTPIEPATNAGFRSTELTTSDLPPTSDNMGYDQDLFRKPSLPAPGTDNIALMEQNGFGQHGRKSSADEHTQHHHTGSPCDMPAHLQSSPKKVPMFAVPSQPTDIDGAGGEAQVQ